MANDNISSTQASFPRRHDHRRELILADLHPGRVMLFSDLGAGVSSITATSTTATSVCVWRGWYNVVGIHGAPGDWSESGRIVFGFACYFFSSLRLTRRYTCRGTRIVRY